MTIFVPYLEGVLLVGLGLSIIFSQWLLILAALAIGCIPFMLYCGD